jgi:hypothetical protein
MLHSYLGWGLIFLTGFVITRTFGPIVRRATSRMTLSVLLVIISTATLYVAWAHLRARYFIYGLEHEVPYPDRALNALERWFDAQHPVSPGMFKLHGGWPYVLNVLGPLVTVLAGATGMIAGLLSRRRDSSGGGSVSSVGPQNCSGSGPSVLP